MGANCSSEAAIKIQDSTGENGPVVPPRKSDAVAARFPNRGKLLQKEPTIGVVLSGGGWRAMESSAYFMDHMRLQGLIPDISVVAGLSGGSWTCIAGGAAGDHNYLYGDAPDSLNSWASTDAAKTDKFIETLTSILSSANVERARRESIAEDKDSERAWYSPVSGLWNILSLFDDQLGALGDVLSLNTDEAYLYNYSCALGYQFLGDNWKQVKLKQTSTPGMPLFVMAAVNEQEGWFEFDGMNGGGLRQLILNNDMTQTRRTSLDDLRIVFNQARTELLTASSLMAICGSAFYKSMSAAVRLTTMDKDGFRAHIYHKDRKTKYDVLHDAGTSCNVPLQLVRTRCKVSFVVDSSHDNYAAEQLEIAVEKGYYHLHIPDGQQQKDFIKKHVAKKWDDGDDVRIFFPNSKHSEPLWGTPSESGRDEPILIYVRALREASTFRMDRTADEIAEAHKTMSIRTKIAYQALDFLMKQDSIPSKGFWSTPDFAPQTAPEVSISHASRSMAGVQDPSASKPIGAWNAYKDPNAIQQAFEETSIKNSKGSITAASLRGEALQLLKGSTEGVELNHRSLSNHVTYQAFAWVAHVTASIEKTNAAPASSVIAEHTGAFTSEEDKIKFFHIATIFLANNAAITPSVKSLFSKAIIAHLGFAGRTDLNDDQKKLYDNLTKLH